MKFKKTLKFKKKKKKLFFKTSAHKNYILII